MEDCGVVFHDEEWESLSKMFSCEDSDFLLNSFSDAQPSTFLADHGSSFLPSASYLDHHSTNFYCEISQESSNSSEIEAGTLFAENGYHGGTADFADESMPVFSDEVMQEILQLKAELWEMDNNNIPGSNTQTTPEILNNINGSCNEMQQDHKRKLCETTLSDNVNNSSDQSPKIKKARVSRNAQKSKRAPRKNKKNVQISNDEEENNNGGGNEQSSSTCSIDDDDSNAKGKASRGSASATDAQSLYARRRRERINERLRILQNLVPNGTKVDISTMLEEAVHYVKFLQLQIRLLSSDDMWMYAPIAYNGMDMGLYHKINNVPNLWPQN